MKRLGHIVDSLSNLAGYFSGWLVPAMALLVFIEVISRYVFRRALLVGDEFAAYMLVALCFLGAAYTWREKGHVRITALVSRLPTKVASWLRLVTLTLVFLFVVGLCQASYGFMAMSFKLHMASPSWLHFPLQGPHMTLPIGFAILAVILMVDIARTAMKIRAGESAGEAPR